MRLQCSVTLFGVEEQTIEIVLGLSDVNVLGSHLEKASLSGKFSECSFDGAKGEVLMNDVVFESCSLLESGFSGNGPCFHNCDFSTPLMQFLHAPNAVNWFNLMKSRMVPSQQAMALKLLREQELQGSMLRKFAESHPENPNPDLKALIAGILDFQSNMWSQIYNMDGMREEIKKYLKIVSEINNLPFDVSEVDRVFGEQVQSEAKENGGRVSGGLTSSNTVSILLAFSFVWTGD
jgi:hypothetical protein